MICKRIREARIKNGITQQKVADYLNIALRTYQCYEGGTREPSLDTIVNIAKYFNVSTDYLLIGEEPKKESEVFFDE